MTLTNPRSPVRPAVTLIELLVVLSIIAMLVALSGAAIYKTSEIQKTKATQKQLFKLQMALDNEYEQVVKQCEADRRQKKIPQEILTYCENNEDRAQAVWTALKLRQQFPDTITEATKPFTFPGYTLQPLVTFQNLNGLTADAHTESALLLYTILASKSTSGGGAMAVSADELNQAREVTLGGKQFRAFTDPYGNILGFRRWFQGGDTQGADYVDSKAAFKDPLDPKGLIVNWADATKAGQMKSLLGFDGLNRLSTIHSPAKDQQVGTGDDLFGYQERRHGK